MALLALSVALAGGHGTESRQARALGESATTYWEGVRWADAGKASPFLADIEQRVLLTQMLDTGSAKLTGVTVIQAELGADPKDGAPRPAVVLVRLEVIDMTLNRYSTVDYVQHWQEVGFNWLVDSALSPLGADRPWTVGAPVKAGPAPAEPAAAMPSVPPAVTP